MIAPRVIECVAAQAGFKKSDVMPENTLEGKLELDSLDRVELVMALEDEFDLIIDDCEADGWVTVADAIASVEHAVAKK